MSLEPRAPDAANRVQVATVDRVGFDVEIAGLGSRSYAFIIDWHIRVLAVMAWFIAAGLLASGGLGGLIDSDNWAGLLTMTVLLPAAAMYFLYHPILEVAMRGSTPGKRMAGVCIVTTDGRPAGSGALLLRNLFRILDCMPGVYAVGILSVLFTRCSVRVGDLAAGTLLTFSQPREDADLSLAAINSPVPLRSAQLMQELLARWNDIEPEKRQNLAWRLLRGLPAGHDLPAEDCNDRDLRAHLKTLVVQA